MQAKQTCKQCELWNAHIFTFWVPHYIHKVINQTLIHWTKTIVYLYIGYDIHTSFVILVCVLVFACGRLEMSICMSTTFFWCLSDVGNLLKVKIWWFLSCLAISVRSNCGNLQIEISKFDVAHDMGF